MNLVRTDDKKYLSPWFPFMNALEDFSDDLFTSKNLSGMDMWETEKSVFVDFAVPAMKESDLDIQLENGVLTVRGTRSSNEEKEEKGKKVWISSMKSNFYYAVTLPSTAGSDVNAELEDGVLKVEIAKKEESKPKKIEVRKKM